MKSGFLAKYGVLAATFILYIGCVIWNREFYTSPEFFFTLMLNQNVVPGLLAIGMTFVIIAGGIDLSVGSMLALCASLALMGMNKLIGGGMAETPAAWVALAIALGSGSLLGLVNGIVIAFGRVAPFIATLVGLLAYRSMAQVLADAGEIRSQSATAFQFIGNSGLNLKVGTNEFSINWAVFVLLACIPLASFILNKTVYGRHVIAVGASERAARYSGIPIRLVKIKTYALMGVFAGLAALMNASRMNSVATTSVGSMAELDAIAAVVIGGTSLRGGSGRIWGSVVGVLLVGLIGTMLTVSGLSEYWKGVVRGGIILLAVLLQRSSRDD